RHGRRGAVLDGDGLRSGDEIATVVGGRPGALGLADFFAAYGEILIRRGDGQRAVASVAEGRRAEARYCRALTRRIGRAARHDRGGVVFDGDGLRGGDKVAAVVGGRPGALGPAHFFAAHGEILVHRGDGQRAVASIAEGRCAEA